MINKIETIVNIITKPIELILKMKKSANSLEKPQIDNSLKNTYTTSTKDNESITNNLKGPINGRDINFHFINNINKDSDNKTDSVKDNVKDSVKINDSVKDYSFSLITFLTPLLLNFLWAILICFDVVPSLVDIRNWLLPIYYIDIVFLTYIILSDIIKFRILFNKENTKTYIVILSIFTMILIQIILLLSINYSNYYNFHNSVFYDITTNTVDYAIIINSYFKITELYNCIILTFLSVCCVAFILFKKTYKNKYVSFFLAGEVCIVIVQLFLLYLLNYIKE